MEISQEILNLVPYKPGKPIEETQRELGLSRVHKLASNENPLGMSPQAKQAVTEALQESFRYPDASFHDLKERVSEYYNIASEDLSFGNGSNEIIDLLIRLFCGPGQELVVGSYSFIAYKVCAQAARVKVHEAASGPDLSIDLNAILQLVESHKEKVSLVFIPNPNNPTGSYIKHQDMEDFLQKMSKFKNTMVVVDEAYNEFVRAEDYAQTSDLFARFENLIIMRTFSKVFGLAGLRVGTLIARPQWIDLFNRIRNPFNVNSLAQVAAAAALGDEDFLKRSQECNWQGLDYFYKEFTSMGLKYYPSQGNFVLVDFQRPAMELYEQLLRQGVIVRPVGGYGLPHCLRISVGLPEENAAAVSALQKLI